MENAASERGTSSPALAPPAAFKNARRDTPTGGFFIVCRFSSSNVRTNQSH
ncbi:MAG: hypothetical protein P8Z40_04245 [Chloroflexota bacterium]